MSVVVPARPARLAGLAPARVALEIAIGTLLVVVAWTASTLATFALQESVGSLTPTFAPWPSMLVLAVAIGVAAVVLAVGWGAVSAAILTLGGIAFSLQGGWADALLTFGAFDGSVENSQYHPVYALGYAISLSGFESWILVLSGAWIAIAAHHVAGERIGWPSRVSAFPGLPGRRGVAAGMLVGTLVVLGAWWIVDAARDALLQDQVSFRRAEWSWLPSLAMLATAIVGTSLLLVSRIAALTAAGVAVAAVVLCWLLGPDLPELLRRVSEWVAAGPVAPLRGVAATVAAAGFDSALLSLAGSWLALAALPFGRRGTTGPLAVDEDAVTRPT